MESQVFLVKTKDKLEGTRWVLEKAGDRVISKLKKVKRPLIHPNLVHDNKPLASVTADVAKVAVDWIRKYTKTPITIADASYHGTKRAFENFGYNKTFGNDPTVRLFDLNDDQSIPVPFYNPDGTDDMAPFCKTVADADFRLTLAKAKTHSYYIMSASIKTTAYGSVVGQPLGYAKLIGKTIFSRSRWYHKDYYAGNKSMARLYKMYPADLLVVDGTIAMEGAGPTGGTPVELGWVLGSTDAVAADAVCAYLMGFEPEQIGYLVFAQKQGIGVADLGRIKIVGPSDWHKLRKKVEPPPGLNELLNWRKPTFSSTPPEL